MSTEKGSLMDLIQSDISKYEGVRVLVKASLPERLLVRKLSIKKLHPNPDDEFSFPSIGPNFSIISDYERRIRMGKLWTDNPDDEPLYVEKMRPDGYMILNGHHRWFAAMMAGLRRVPVRVVNTTRDSDIDAMLNKSENDKRVALDLDEVVFSSEGTFEKKPMFVPRTFGKEHVRLGIPALTQFLSGRGYDIWVYSNKLYPDDIISRLLFAYHIRANGVIAGYSRKRWKQMNIGEQIEKKIMNKYSTTLNITNEEIIKINSEAGDFTQFDIGCEPSEWSKTVIQTIKGWDDEKR